MGRIPLPLIAGLLAGALIIACGDDEPGDAGFETLAVPDDYATVQEAVDAAQAGDLVLISPGVYNEAVTITTDNLTLRGLDRNEVILDGEFTRENGVKVLEADGVAVENLTARNYTVNGFFWSGVTGYRGSYLTAYRNGDYGIYAFDSVKGQFDHSYASGSPDAGFYIGQCYPCDAVITDVISERNGLGYSGTNSGGNLLIVSSIFRLNRVGITPNSGAYELCYPERETTIVGNLVYSNSQPDTPAIDDALLAMGNGILVAGGVGNIVERNRVSDHDKTGIGLVPAPEESPADTVPPDDELKRSCAEARNDPTPDPASLPDSVLWQPKANRVVGNVVEDSRVADLALGSVGVDLASLGNCFADNQFATTAPNALETLAPCDGPGSGDWDDGPLDLPSWLTEQHPPSADYKTSPEPESQPNMPDAATAPPRPATDVPPAVDLAAITVPDR